MAHHNRVLQVIASKIGLSGEEKVLSKAAEFHRLLQIKSSASGNITDTGKVVICLDLAADVYGVPFNVRTAIKCSGLRANIYTNYRKVVEKLLDLNSDRLTIAALCVALKCNEAMDLAEKILSEYQKRSKMEIDLELPHFVCMAVYQACKLKHIKIARSKFLEKARIKLTQWTKLDTEWTALVNTAFVKQDKTAKKGNTNKGGVNDDEKEMQVEYIVKKDISNPEPQIEPYEDWKRRVLEAAYKELILQKELEVHHQILIKPDDSTGVHRSPTKSKSPRRATPRKSTRLTPRKAPAVSPRKAQAATPRKSPIVTPHKMPIVMLVRTPIVTPGMSPVVSPRRSQRTTPLKFDVDPSPKKNLNKMEDSPMKSSVVRLLFPTDL